MLLSERPPLKSGVMFAIGVALVDMGKESGVEPVLVV